jgi:hypothetical protein
MEIKKKQTQDSRIKRDSLVGRLLQKKIGMLQQDCGSCGTLLWVLVPPTNQLPRVQPKVGTKQL